MARRHKYKSTPGLRPVDEATRINIQEALKAFQESEETTYAFPLGLSNHDRAVVHGECGKFGFKSKSRGVGANRRVVLTKAGVHQIERHAAADITFSPQSASLIQNYTARFPPCREESNLANLGQEALSMQFESSPVHQFSRNHRKRKLGQYAASFTVEEVKSRQARWKKSMQEPAQIGINSVRQALPIFKNREKILKAVRENQVVMIAGETGCGKTTQVPQYLLEEAWSESRGCRIVCTQPRRISAVTISDRVATERGEKCGENVGYTIRLESRGGSHCSLMFCTNGVLLRQLTHGNELQDITHIIIDEIHERDSFSDFLLILLRDVLPSHPALRLVLMSATLHVDLFASYFNHCPVVQVPGFTHPVHDVYLDEMLPLIGYKAEGTFSDDTHMNAPDLELPAHLAGTVDDAIFKAMTSDTPDEVNHLMEVASSVTSFGSSAFDHAHSTTGVTSLMVMACKGRREEAESLLSMGAKPDLKAKNGMTAADFASKFNHSQIVDILQDHVQAVEQSEKATESALLLSQYQAITDAEEVDLDLIEKLLMFVCGEGPHARDKTADAALGAVLIFLPGWEEIIRLKEKLEGSPQFNSSHFLILALHSMVPAAEQREVFVRPPPGRQKIILATNIAETAVTIDDIVCVINSGRMKEKSYDPYMEVSTLMSTWVSKASEKQRRGRAGRCQPGVCFHLYTKQRSEALQDFQTAELQRTPLDELCIQAKQLHGQSGTVVMLKDFLGKAVEPPPAPSISNAIKSLTEIGALEPVTENLTTLGKSLASMPLSPKLGKMLLYGILFGVLDPLLTIASSISYRTPWMMPTDPEKRRQANKAKAQLGTEAGVFSDHLALVRAFDNWSAAGTPSRQFRYSADLQLNNATLRMIDGFRRQILSELMAQGYIGSTDDPNRNAGNSAVVRAVLGAALYPQFGQIIETKQKHCKLVTPKQEKIRVHPSSINASMKLPGEGPWNACKVLFFDEKVRQETQLFAMQTTLTTAHLLLLIANSLSELEPDSESDVEMEDAPYGDEQTTLLVDNWLCVQIKSHILKDIFLLRHRLAQCFTAKVKDPKRGFNRGHQALLETMVRVLDVEWANSGLNYSLKWASRDNNPPSRPKIVSLLKRPQDGHSPPSVQSISIDMARQSLSHPDHSQHPPGLSLKPVPRTAPIPGRNQMQGSFHSRPIRREERDKRLQHQSHGRERLNWQQHDTSQKFRN